MKYQPVIGLEVHVQANTKSKMFCFCAADYFEHEPNSHVCPVCLGLPGALPVPNKAAIDKCIKISLALNCKIAAETKFDRKNYFYPDLPKAYQISQYDQPIGYDGYLELDMADDAKRIRIRRVHQEEDTGKSMHESDRTLLDFNKSGVPLMEIVTEPDFETIEEVMNFSYGLKQIIEYTGVSDAEMQKGQMRFELNISLRQESDGKNLPNYRVEVKNIGSISVLEKVIEFETERQSKLLDAGEEIKNETRGLLDMSGETVRQRVKETEDDYRYFPEPDIPPIEIDEEWIAAIQQTIPELPVARKRRYMDEFGLEIQQADILVTQPEKGEWVDGFHTQFMDKDISKEAIKWLTGEISAYLERRGQSVEEMQMTQEDMHYLISEMNAGNISGSIFKKFIEASFEGKADDGAKRYIEDNNLALVQDDSQLEAWIDQVISENDKIVQSIAKNPNAVKALIGKTMALSRGKASPQKVEQLLESKLL